jgi:hypothetical protein
LILYELAALFIALLFIKCSPSKAIDEIEILSADRLINKLEANRRRIKNFEGSGTIIVNTPTLENTANFRIVIIKPDSIFLNILGPFGIELGQALVTKKDFVFYDALSNTAYIGQTNSETLQNIFRIDLPFTDLIDALIGSVNLTNHLYRKPDDFNIIYDRYNLTYYDHISGNTTNYKIDVRRLGITDYSLVSDEFNIIGKYSNFEIIDNVAIPFNIIVENKLSKQKIEVNYKKIRVNKSEIKINFQIPDDADIVKW